MFLFMFYLDDGGQTTSRPILAPGCEPGNRDCGTSRLEASNVCCARERLAGGAVETRVVAVKNGFERLAEDVLGVGSLRIYRSGV